MSAGGRGGGQHGGSGNQGGPGNAAGHADMGGGFLGMFGQRPPSPYATSGSAAFRPPSMGLMAPSPAMPTAAAPQTPMPMQGLMSQQLPGSPPADPFGGRFGPMHPLLQYLIGQIPGRPGLTA